MEENIQTIQSGMTNIKFSQRSKIILFILLILLNMLLRYQLVLHEIGDDSFIIHVMANSISDFGYANWVKHPLSLIGFYPLSEASSVPFIVSGIFQTSSLEMDYVIFIFGLFLGIFGGFIAYLSASMFTHNDLIKFIAAFGFSISGALLDLTTWTLGTRGLFVVIASLIVYLLLKSRTSYKYILLIFISSFLAIATHRMFAYLIPVVISFIITTLLFKVKLYYNIIKIPLKINIIFTIAGFFTMFSLPFLFGKFLETSRYTPIYESYVRYTGIFVLFAISGLIYLIFKYDKNFEEWFLVLTLMGLTALIYQQTYFKFFIPIFVILIACISLSNVAKLINEKKIALYVIILFLMVLVSFSAYYQFLHDYARKGGINERYIEHSTYLTGRWMKDYAEDVSISNDRYFGLRVFAASETVKQITPLTLIDHVYGFIEFNISEYILYPITSEKFWYDTGSLKYDSGELIWYNANMNLDQNRFNISLVVENVKAKGLLVWHHTGITQSKILQFASVEKNLVYSNGDGRVWKIN